MYFLLMVMLRNFEINIGCANLSSVGRHLSGVNTFPAMLNSLSTGAEEDGTPRTFLPTLIKGGISVGFLSNTLRHWCSGNFNVFFNLLRDCISLLTFC